MDHTTYKILSDYLSKGIYPDNLDKTEKRSIRSQANPFRMKELLMYLSTLPEDNTVKEAFWVKDYQLREADRDIILNGEWLNDKQIDTAYIEGKVTVADRLNIVLTLQVTKQLRQLYKGQIQTNG